MSGSSKTTRRILFLLFVAALTSGLVLAGTDERAVAEEPESQAHEEAVARAIRSGEAVPVVRVLETIRGHFDGQVLALELRPQWNGDGSFWVYEAKILMSDGDVLEVEYDALSLDLIDLERPGRRAPKGDDQ